MHPKHGFSTQISNNKKISWEVNGGVPLKWVTFFQEIPKHGVWFCAGKSLNMPTTFVILL